MPLTKQQKAQVVDEITGRLEAMSTIYVTDYMGLTVEQANELRSRFREAGVDFAVVKNTLLKLAMERIGGFDELFEHLNGPTAVALSTDPSAPARVIKKFVQDRSTERPGLKVAFIEGALYEGDQLDVLAALKSKDELIADIIGLLLSPIANVVGAVQSPGQTLVGALKTIAEKGEA